MRKIMIFILIFLLLLSTGCQGRIELSDLGIATMMGIDWNNDEQQYEVTLNIIKYTQGSQKGLSARNNSWVVSGKGSTIRDAMGKIDARANRTISGLALSVVLIGKQAGEHGVDEILDFLTRDRDYRDTLDVLTTDYTASYIMKLLPEHEFDIQQEIEKSIEQSDWLRSYAPSLRDVYVDYDENGGYFVTGMVSSMNPLPFSKIQRKEADKVENPNDIAYVSGSAVYKKGKLVGFMDPIDTRSFVLVTRKDKNIAKKTDVVADIKSENSDINASFNIKSLDSRTDVSLDGKISVNINVDLEANLEEFISPHNIDVPTINILQGQINKKIKLQIESMLSKTQGIYGSDIIGVYNLLHKKYPQYWKQNKGRWNDTYCGITFNVNVNTKITQTGLITNSYKEY